MTHAQRSIAARLDAARERSFVGRATEIELFVQTLEQAEPAFNVFFIHGPGGIGKSSLLDRYARELSAHGIRCLRLDARSSGATPASFLGAIGVETLAQLAERLAPRGALLLDTYEELAALDAWLREALLPTLPLGSLLVIAGREPPAVAWRADPGIAAMLRVRALDNLALAESEALLAARGVDAARFGSTVHALTHGHPLALALAAELLRETQGNALPVLTPDIVRVLLDRIVRGLAEPAHRRVLEVAALARVVTEDLLRDLELEPSAGLFAWLRGLSYAREMSDGIALHDLVRDAVAAELRFRDPSYTASLRKRVLERSRRVLATATGRARERAFYDVLFSMRSDPATRPFYDWERDSQGETRPLRADELESALVDVFAHEGAGGVALARHYYARQPQAFVALVDHAGNYLGLLVYLRFTQFDPTDLRADPALERIAAIVSSEGPLRTGEDLTVLRFWVWRNAYQELGSAAHGPHSMFVSFDWAASGSLAWCFPVVQRSETWREFLRSIGFGERAGTFLLSGHEFTLFARDFRRAPWGATGEGTGGESPRPERVVLAEADFATAVRDALRSASSPAELAKSPLLGTRMLFDWAESEAPSAEMLRELLEVALSAQTGADDERPQRCVELTFLRGAPTQEIAAERLGLSFSTYRRQLERGIERVVAYLWQRELGRG